MSKYRYDEHGIPKYQTMALTQEQWNLVSHGLALIKHSQAIIFGPEERDQAAKIQGRILNLKIMRRVTR
jgi:hypothetical protein